MGRSQETFNKKEKEKKRLKKKQDKLKKREERKASSEKGKGLDDMIAYVDEEGNITSTPPDPDKKKKIKAEDIEITVSRQDDSDAESAIRKGKVSFFNDSRGYGFITDLDTRESIFVHVNGLVDQVKEGDRVTFETEKGQKGLNAVNVRLMQE
jgi:cold shock CspA family protein